MVLKRITYLILGLLIYTNVVSQNNNDIDWITFEQLEDSLSQKPKKVFIDFYTDWCTYCKKMDKVTFTDTAVISKLNSDYYAIKMNAESRDTIVFGGDTFINKQIEKKRNPTHDIPLLLASRENYPFSLPAMIILNENFEIMARYFEYMSPEKLHEALAK